MIACSRSIAACNTPIALEERLEIGRDRPGARYRAKSSALVSYSSRAWSYAADPIGDRRLVALAVPNRELTTHRFDDTVHEFAVRVMR
jgi:hypothetical protein